MESKIAAALKLDYEPVAILWSDEKPQDATQFKEGKWGCVMWKLANAAKGKAGAFDRETFGCQGGGTGLGFGNQYENFMGGLEGFCHFLSYGNEKTEREEIAEQIERYGRKEAAENFLKGERYVKTPELVKKFLERLPMRDISSKYVVFKPLSKVEEDEQPVVIVFVVKPHQLSALIVLANYDKEDINNVIAPMGAGCHQIGILSYSEAESDNPRAVIGLTDLSARKNVRRQLGEDVFTFAVPYKMFKEMEENVEGSFVERDTWKSLVE
ncbi:MAG: DUF169 domain-containing protein [Archaeoglobaceae archaeon]